MSAIIINPYMVAPSATGFTTTAREFDGSLKLNYYSTPRYQWRAVDSKFHTIVACIYPKESGQNSRKFYDATSGDHMQGTFPSSVEGVRVQIGVSFSVAYIQTTATLSAKPWTLNQWNTIACSANKNTGIIQLRVNGILLSGAEVTSSMGQNGFDFVADWGDTEWGRAATTNTEAANHYASQIWMDNSFIDFSVQANYDKFFDANDKPIDLGPTGNLPTGSTPLHFAPDGDLSNNVGSQNNWTKNGTIPIAPSSPTD